MYVHHYGRTYRYLRNIYVCNHVLCTYNYETLQHIPCLGAPRHRQLLQKTKAVAKLFIYIYVHIHICIYVYKSYIYIHTYVTTYSVCT